MKKLLLVLLCTLLTAVYAQDSETKAKPDDDGGKNAIGIGAGTPGLGLEFKRKINDYIVDH